MLPSTFYRSVYVPKIFQEFHSSEVLLNNILSFSSTNKLLRWSDSPFFSHISSSVLTTLCSPFFPSNALRAFKAEFFEDVDLISFRFAHLTHLHSLPLYLSLTEVLTASLSLTNRGTHCLSPYIRPVL